MLPRRQRRIVNCSYRGPRTYFLTVLTRQRRRVFEDEALATLCRTEILRAASERGFAIDAGTLMPDHAHLLVTGLTGDSDLCSFMKLAKQLSGFHVKRITGQKLWAAGYYDRVLRHDEDPRRYIEYILMNPVRAKLADIVGAHPHTWASTPDRHLEGTSKPDLQVGRATNQQPAGTGPPDLKVGPTGTPDLKVGPTGPGVRPSGILNPEKSCPD